MEQVYGPWDDRDQRARFDSVTRVADHAVVELDGQPIGFTSVTSHDADVYLVRLMILPAFQNRGFGGEIIRRILRSADERSLPVRLRVMRVNPARRLYERNGFAIVQETETHHIMVRPVRRR